MESESPRLRLSILAIIVVSLFGALFARLWYLQVMAAPQFQDVAAANRERVIYEEAPRGRILDRNGRVIVDNRTSLVVTASPRQLDQSGHRNDVLLRLATALTDAGTPTKVATLERRLNDKQYSPLQPIPVAIDIPEALEVELAERAEDFPGVEVTRESVRAYPNGPLAAHVVGYVGRISEQELEARMGTKDNPKEADKPYQPDSDIGKAGVERTFEDDLRGQPGVRRIEIDAKGTPIRTIDYTPPRSGNDLQLTIDLDIQANAEATLSAQLDAIKGGVTREGTKTAQAGSLAAVDPRNGEVLAMASFPTYDPAEFVNGISTERYAQLTGGDAADNPFPNRAIAGEYAPGSTFKLVTAYGGLDRGLVTASSPFYDGGCLRVGDRDFCNAGKVAHGAVPMPRALTVSSDVYFYSLGQRFWNQRDEYGDGIQSAARGFGFGTATGVQLPGESAGIIPDPEYKRKLWEALPPDQQRKGDPNWYPGDNVNLAIGQGYVLATPLQLANAYATFVNHGQHHQPNIALRVLIPAGDPTDPRSVVKSFEPRVDHTVDLPDNVFEPVHEGLIGVASSREGTAYDAFRGFDLKSFPVFSKTGTAQVQGKADNALFVACGPDPAYRICVSAVLEQAGFGGEAAAPVVRRVLEPLAGQAQSDWKPGVVRGND